MATRGPAEDDAIAAGARDEARDDVAEIEHALSRIAYLARANRAHDRLRALAGVSLDRAAVTLLREIADTGPLRPSELAARLTVEAAHVTRQVRQLEDAGYVSREPDPHDRRARRIALTPQGRDALDRVRAASRRAMRRALSDWSPEDLRQLAVLFHRMVDDLVIHGFQESQRQQQEQQEQREGTGASDR